MSDKYHISPVTGNPNRCYASKKPCPVGGADEHYSSKEEAREAYEKSQSEGGQTVTKLKKTPAPSSDTQGKSASVTSIGGTTITPEMTEKYREVVTNSYISTTPPLNNSEKKILSDVAAGKTISDEKLDAMIDRLRHVATHAELVSEKALANGKIVLPYLKAVRSKSPNPNTLKDVKDFDPATQTVFSNKDARRHPMIAGKAIRRTSAHIDWMNQLADDARAIALEVEKDPEAREVYRNKAAIWADEALRSEVKLRAQLKEIQYQYDNDETFRNNTNLSIASHLRAGVYRDTDSKYNGIPLEGVKKA